MNRNTLCAAMLAALGNAVADSDNAVEVLEPITVTATRLEAPVQRVGRSVTVIDQETIRRRGVTQVLDLLRDVPGVSVSRGGTFGSQTQLRVRGAEANQLLVLIDGVEANDPAGDDGFAFEHLTTADVDRIEIVRGPMSALWGTDALAGVVNIITTRNAATPTEVYGEAGNHGTFRVGGAASAAGDRWRLRAMVDHFSTDGTNISRTGDEDDASRTSTGALSAGYDVSEAVALRFSLRTVRAHSEFDTVDFVNTGLPADADVDSDIDRDYIRAGVSWKPAGQWSHEATLARMESDNANFSAGIETSATSAQENSLRWQSHWQFADAHRLTLAADYEDTRFVQEGQATAFGDPNQRQSVDNLGLVAEYLGAITPSLDVAASIRWDDHSDFENATTWQGAITWAVSSQSSVRASYGTSRKAPTFTERFGFFADSFVGNPDLAPEESESFELGYDLRMARGRLGLTWFDSTLEDEINGFFFDAGLGTFTAINEDGASDRSGIEMDGQYDVTEVLTLVASYTYLDATEGLSDRREIDEIRRPRHMGRLGGNLELADGRANLNLNLSYNGAQMDLFFPPFPEPSTRVVLDDYWLVDLAASWSVTPSLDLYGRAANLLDEDYEDVYGFATPGRTVTAGLRFRF